MANSNNVSNINFRMDSELKKKMENICVELGLNLTTAFTIFAKAVVRGRDIPFSLSLDPYYDENNMDYLKNIVQDIEEGKAHFSEHELIDVED